ncbi:hypothetical protein ACYPKM_01755 [Pseudomonas aeruginosa]
MEEKLISPREALFIKVYVILYIFTALTLLSGLFASLVVFGILQIIFYASGSPLVGFDTFGEILDVLLCVFAFATAALLFASHAETIKAKLSQYPVVAKLMVAYRWFSERRR